MPLTLFRPQEAQLQHVIFGKLPSRSDFLRINATHPVAAELDDLIQGTMEQFRLQEGWEARYDRASFMDICYTSMDRKWIFLGALLASRDESGRRYPLVAGVASPAAAALVETRLIPIACEVFFEGLREQLSHTVHLTGDALSCRDFLESQTAAWTSDTSDLALASEIVDRFMKSKHPSVIEAPFSDGGPKISVMQATLNLAFYRDFLRRFNDPSVIQVIDMPLTQERGQSALHACAWLNLLASFSGMPVPWKGSYLARHGREDTRMFVAFGRLPWKVMLAALGGDIPSDDRLDLCNEQKAWQAHKLYAESDYAMHCLFNAPSLTLSELREFLREITQKIAVAGG